jgi:hypothetical protein
MKDNVASASHCNNYILNREYFTECFDESADTPPNVKKYSKALLLIVMACVFFAIKVEIYVSWFLLALGIVELLSIRYKRSWWVSRQMLSRSAGSKVNIRINDKGIFADSTHHQQNILWSDISEIKNTERGYVIIYNRGTNYLSKRKLDEDYLNLLAEKSIAII